MSPNICLKSQQMLCPKYAFSLWVSNSTMEENPVHSEKVLQVSRGSPLHWYSTWSTFFFFWFMGSRGRIALWGSPDGARCCQMVPDAASDARCCQMLPDAASPDAARCCQMLPDAARCSQMLPDAPRCCQMLPGQMLLRCCQMLPGAARSCQMLQMPPDDAQMLNTNAMPNAMPEHNTNTNTNHQYQYQYQYNTTKTNTNTYLGCFLSKGHYAATCIMWSAFAYYEEDFFALRLRSLQMDILAFKWGTQCASGDTSPAINGMSRAWDCCWCLQLLFVKQVLGLVRMAGTCKLVAIMSMRCRSGIRW